MCGCRMIDRTPRSEGDYASVAEDVSVAEGVAVTVVVTVH